MLLTLELWRTLAFAASRSSSWTGAHAIFHAATNAELIAEFSEASNVCRSPLNSGLIRGTTAAEARAKKLKKSLAQILRIDTFSSAFRSDGLNGERKKGLREKVRKKLLLSSAGKDKVDHSLRKMRGVDRSVRLRRIGRGLTEMPEGSKRHSVFLSPDAGTAFEAQRLKVL